jgi:hypothetical protein
MQNSDVDRVSCKFSLYKKKACVLLYYSSFFSSVNLQFTIMDSKVVHSHVQEENDEQNSQNVESQQGMVTVAELEQNVRGGRNGAKFFFYGS